METQTKPISRQEYTLTKDWVDARGMGRRFTRNQNSKVKNRQIHPTILTN